MDVVSKRDAQRFLLFLHQAYRWTAVYPSKLRQKFLHVLKCLWYTREMQQKDNENFFSPIEKDSILVISLPNL